MPSIGGRPRGWCAIFGNVSSGRPRTRTRSDALEPCAGQLARTVLRGGWCSDVLSLPDYSGSNRYICHLLHREQGDPVCQHLPADPIDARVVEAFFAAVTPAELEAWTRAQDARHRSDEALDRAEAQQVERLRYQALLAERQFNKVDPDNRNVAGELEHRWELALRELRQAEEALSRHRAERAAPETLSDRGPGGLPRPRPPAAGALGRA